MGFSPVDRWSSMAEEILDFRPRSRQMPVLDPAADVHPVSGLVVFEYDRFADRRSRWDA